jgi:hypothetical protein
MDTASLNSARPAGAQENPAQPAHHGLKRGGHHKKHWLKIVIVAVIVIVVVVGGGLLWNHHNSQRNSNSEAAAINHSEYQAVFLTNGQVYFGKLATVNRDYLKLTDIYYLQVQQSVQPSTSSTSAAASNTSSGSNNGQVQLVKLGNELHGPEDQMAINRQQVLFWENLKPSGKVTQAINQYQNK